MPKNLTVSLEDKPGSLAKLGEALGTEGINIEGICGVTVGGRGEIHLLVEDADGARSAIEGAGFVVSGERDVIVVDIEDRPGELGGIARRLAENSINLELLYLSASMELILGVDDYEKARFLLS
jgi:hypothetical protein